MWLAAQLIVVFLGVYSASWVAERRVEQERSARRAQLHRALVAEVRSVTEGAKGAAAGTGRLLALYDSAWGVGGQPRLMAEPLMDPVRVTAHMWNATVASGGLELLDVSTFYQLSRFHNELAGGFDQLAQLRSLAETQLIPLADAPASAFYDPVTGQLRRQYGWYPTGLRSVHALARRLASRGDSLVAVLERTPR
jgi:hypothetical protein